MLAVAFFIWLSLFTASFLTNARAWRRFRSHHLDEWHGSPTFLSQYDPRRFGAQRRIVRLVMNRASKQDAVLRSQLRLYDIVSGAHLLSFIAVPFLLFDIELPPGGVARWGLPLLAAAASCLMIFLSHPERAAAAVVAAALTLTVGVWEAASSFTRHEVDQRIRSDAHHRLRLATNRFKSDLRTLASSTDPSWAPQNADEFFSIDTARLICSISPSGMAATIPKIRWDAYVAKAAEQLSDSLEGVLFNQAPVLDPSLLEHVSELRHSSILLIFQRLPNMMRIQHDLNPRIRQSLCFGLEEFLRNALEELHAIHLILVAASNPPRIPVSEPWEEMQRARATAQESQSR